MPKNNSRATARNLKTLAGRCYFSGRSQMNLARDVERDAEAIVCPYGNDETRADAVEDLPERVSRLIAEIDEQAKRLIQLRATLELLRK